MMKLGMPRARCLVETLVGLALWAWSAPASASGCPIRVEPPTASDWLAAARAAEEQAARGNSVASDCAAIELTVKAEGGARLRFTTSSGRSGVRELDAPSDVASALEALYVTLAPTPPPTTTPTPAPAAVPAAPAVVLAAPAPPPSRAHFVLGAEAGGRLTFFRRYLAPTVGARAELLLKGAELGVLAGWDPIYARLSGSTPADFAMSSVLVNVLCGARTPARSVDLNYGVTLGIASVASSARDEPRIGRSRSVDAAEPRLGAYFGTSLPRAASTRARVEFRVDAALSGLRGAATSELELPALPRYGLVLCAGFESEAL